MAIAPHENEVAILADRCTSGRKGGREGGREGGRNGRIPRDLLQIISLHPILVPKMAWSYRVGAVPSQGSKDPNDRASGPKYHS